jgi:hypothetical protein
VSDAGTRCTGVAAAANDPAQAIARAHSAKLAIPYWQFKKMLTKRWGASAATTTRSNHGFQLSPRVPLIKHRDAEPAAAIAMRAAQPELQIEDEEIRRQPIAPLVTYTLSRHFL